MCFAERELICLNTRQKQINHNNAAERRIKRTTIQIFWGRPGATSLVDAKPRTCCCFRFAAHKPFDPTTCLRKFDQNSNINQTTAALPDAPFSASSEKHFQKK